jgi:hypothetical protein
MRLNRTLVTPLPSRVKSRPEGPSHAPPERAALSWALWRRPRQEGQTLLAAALATQANVERQKEIKLMGQTIGEAIWEEGWLKGHSEGELKVARRMLRQLLTDRFGEVPEAVVQRIESATDVDRLTAAALRVSRIDNPEDLQL